MEKKLAENLFVKIEVNFRIACRLGRKYIRL